MNEIRSEILKHLEKNSKADLGELAILLGTDEISVANEIADMEKEGIICGYQNLLRYPRTLFSEHNIAIRFIAHFRVHLRCLGRRHVDLCSWIAFQKIRIINVCSHIQTSPVIHTGPFQAFLIQTKS